ncbi:hypothetical protein Rsub_01337 [Raphidocelis subcapitata]|uniref:Uncharacterized protein n=1 Tax=Raphidocelis subcapitata TaxID=307507 RepID=A0A2V0NPX8_9CHLO|nr:hypothetical protein Rsub_01337 [Raphidocelis subcapitata]|eukprot:GBF88622.1 hypothetical protein Rsub_01337 [Raphidocelis subcapitata]
MTPPPPCCSAEEAAEARAVAAAMAKAAIEKIITADICHNIVATALAKAVENYNEAEAAKATPKRGTSASALAERAKTAIVEGSKALLQRAKSVKSIKTPASPKIPASPKTPTSPKAQKPSTSAGAQLVGKAKALFKTAKSSSLLLGKRSTSAEADSPATDSPATVEATASVVVELAIAAPKTASGKVKAAAAISSGSHPKAPLGKRMSAALKRVFVCGSCSHQLPLL